MTGGGEHTEAARYTLIFHMYLSVHVCHCESTGFAQASQLQRGQLHAPDENNAESSGCLAQRGAWVDKKLARQDPTYSEQLYPHCFLDTKIRGCFQSFESL